MSEHDWLAARFEENRLHLQGVAFRLLGSLSEAEDAVQESWIRLNRTDVSAVENLRGWLTTVVGRVCLDLLRSRRARREERFPDAMPEAAARSETNPEDEAVLADSVGLALLVVLETLSPAERVAFVLHDVFAVPFDEIGPILQRSPVAARQLASRARRRVVGSTVVRDVDLVHERAAVDAFLAAARGGDFEALLALLDPDVVLRSDSAAVRTAAAREVRGAAAVARRAAAGGARAAQPALVDGRVGVVVAPRGRLMMVLDFSFTDGKISAIEAVAEPERLRRMELAVLDV